MQKTKKMILGVVRISFPILGEDVEEYYRLEDNRQNGNATLRLSIITD